MLLRAATGAFLFCLGAVCYALLGILSQLSKSPDGSYAYSLPSIVLLAELTKLCLSFVFLSMEAGSLPKALHIVASSSMKAWMYCAVPSALYALNNNLDMLNNQYMDPATEQVLVQGKILTTGIVWWLVFQEDMGARKWFSLMILLVGTVLAGWPSEKAGSESKQMYIDSVGVLLVMVYIWVSASAGVYNEWLYKSANSKDSIHTCNIRLYLFGCAMNLSAHFFNDPSPSSLFSLTSGYNRYCWALVCTYALMGLLLAQVMKFFDNIVKLFISGSSMYVSAVLSYALFGYTPTARFCFGMVLVTIAMVLYNYEKIFSSVKKSQ